MKYKLPVLSIIFLIVISCRQHDPRVTEDLEHGIEKELQINNFSYSSDTNEVLVWITKGDLLYGENIDSAIIYFYKALNRSYQINYTKGIVGGLLHLGSSYYKKSDFKKSLKFFYTAIPYLTLGNSKNNLPGLYNYLGSIYFMGNKYDSALHFYYHSANFLQKQENIDTLQLAQTYMNIGAVVETIDKDYNRAMNYSQKARTLANFQKDTSLLAGIYKNIATLHSRKGNDSALWYFNLSLQHYKHLRSKSNIIDIYNALTTISLYKNNINDAETYLDSALKTDEAIAQNSITILENLGCVYYFKGEFKKAIPYYLNALKLSDKKRISNPKLNIYATLAILYDTIGQGHQAYRYQVKYSNLKDSLLDEEKVKAVNQLEIQYRVSEKDRELAIKDRDILKKQAQSQRKTTAIWITSLSILLLLTILIFLRYQQILKLRQIRQQKELDLLNATIEGEEAERLRVGQELHDGISGMLSAIKMNLVALRVKRQDIAKECNFVTTIELADEAADELRKTAHNMVPSSLINNGITKAISGFCERVNASLDINIQVCESGIPRRPEPAKELILYRIIQELVHNMIKHSEATEGMVSFSWQKELLLITIEDNGIGLAAPEHEGGIGMNNVKKRIKALNGSIEISNIENEGTSIYLEFPLEEEY